MTVADAPRRGDPAVDYALSRVGKSMPAAGYCLQFTRENFAIPSYYAAAVDAWNGCEERHPGDRNPPAAVPLWFDTPSPYGHVCFAVGDGTVVTTNGAAIQRWSSIGAIESGFNGPYMGWGHDLNRYGVDPNTLPAPTPDPGDLMTYHGNATSKATMSLKPKTWTTLRINDDGDMSILSGPGYFSALVQVSATGVTPGHQLSVRFKCVDVKSGSDSKRASTYKPTEIIGTGGTTEGQAAQLGSIGKPASGWSRRLRAEVYTYDTGVVITSVQARGFN